jgi:cyanophycinase
MGPLYLVGGGETPPEVVTAYLESVGRDSLIVVLGQVREEPQRAESSREMLIEAGARHVVLIPFDRFGETELAVTEKLVSQAHGIWIPGGDQGALMDRFGDEWARRVIGGAVRRGAAYFGTSAGAMLASDLMIAGNGSEPGTALIRKGLGLVPWVVDSHYRERNRQARLAWTLRQTGIEEGLGLSEKEWVKIQGGKVTFRSSKPGN